MAESTEEDVREREIPLRELVTSTLAGPPRIECPNPDCMQEYHPYQLFYISECRECGASFTLYMMASWEEAK